MTDILLQFVWGRNVFLDRWTRLLLVKQPLAYCVREDVSFCNEFIESLFIEVHLHNQPKKNDVVIGVIYRPPDTDINSFVAIITDILSVIKAERKTCYLLGDFNINLINVSNHNLYLLLNF